MKISIKLQGSQQAINKLKVAGRLSFADELREVGDYMTLFYGKYVFDTEGSIIGEKWPALKPKYEFWKRRVRPGVGILELYSNLRNSFNYLHSDRRLMFFTNIPYANVHQYGWPARNIPRRTFLKWVPITMERITDIMSKGIERRLNAVQ